MSGRGGVEDSANAGFVTEHEGQDFVRVLRTHSIAEQIAKHKAYRDYHRELAREEMRTIKAYEKLKAEGVEFIRC